MKSESTVSSDEFRAALSNFASGITVVVSRDEKNHLHGITVSAFCSVSLNPPLILVCIDKAAGSHDSLRIGSALVVNILGENHEAVSEKFASLDADKFDGRDTIIGIDDLPVFSDAIASLQCRVIEIIPAGDHSIFVANVLHTRIKGGKPLLHFEGIYGKFV